MNNTSIPTFCPQTAMSNRSPEVLPVIHHLDYETSLKQAILAKGAGANGVFLISHHNEDDEVLKIAADLKEYLSGFKVGINLLSRTAQDACQSAKEIGLDMVWVDNAGVRSEKVEGLGFWLAEFSLRNPEVEIFGSVAFKYQAIDHNPAVAAAKAHQLGLIPTTSGSATGVAPDVAKIQTMSGATSGRLAIASGMSVNNVDAFKRYLSHILVSTGVSKDDYHFDPEELVKFIQRTRQHELIS